MRQSYLIRVAGIVVGELTFQTTHQTHTLLTTQGLEKGMVRAGMTLAQEIEKELGEAKEK